MCTYMYPPAIRHVTAVIAALIATGIMYTNYVAIC